jgi:hypothetical protein
VKKSQVVGVKGLGVVKGALAERLAEGHQRTVELDVAGQRLVRQPVLPTAKEDHLAVPIQAGQGGLKKEAERHES